MFKFVRTHSQPTRDHPLTDTLFVYIAWQYKPSQPIGDHPLWPCPLRIVSNFLCYLYIYNIHTHAHTHIYIYIHTYGSLSLSLPLLNRLFVFLYGGFHKWGYPCSSSILDWEFFNYKPSSYGEIGYPYFQKPHISVAVFESVASNCLRN